MSELPDRPVCRRCQKVVESFHRGRSLGASGRFFYELRCHGDVERVEYWPLTPVGKHFEPEHGFPAERPSSQDARFDAPAEAPGVRGLLDVQDELLAMPAYQRVQQVKTLGRSMALLKANAEELLAHLRFLTDDRASFELTTVHRRADQQAEFDEVVRRLHNFVAAAMTLVDHTRRLHDALYADGSFRDYPAELDRQLRKDPLVQFVQSLRQLTQHVRIPEISFLVHFEQGKPLVRRLRLLKADLQQWDRWKSDAKKFLDDAPAYIDLTDVVERYLAKVLDFHRWLSMRQEQLHADDVVAIQAKQAEAAKMIAADLPSTIAMGLSIREQGVGLLHDVFAPLFAPRDWVALRSLEGDLPSWIDAAIALVTHRYGSIPEELRDRLRAASLRPGTNARRD